MQRHPTLLLAVLSLAPACAPATYVPPTPPAPSLAVCEGASSESTLSQGLGATAPRMDLVFDTGDGLQACVPECDRPCVHELPPVPVGTVLTTSFAARDIAQTGASILRALSFTVDSDFAFELLAPTPEAMAEGQDQCITVSFSPNVAGEAEATLRLETDGDNAYDCDRVVEVSLIGVGE